MPDPHAPTGDPRERLLAVRLSALGDVIHTLPAIAALRQHFDVDWIVENAYREIVAEVGGVRPIPVSLRRWSLRNILDARRGVLNHTIAIDFQSLTKSALVAVASGARERFGFARPFVREAPAAWLSNRPVSIDAALHVVEWNLQLARAVGRARSLTIGDGGALAMRERFRQFGTGTSISGAVILLPGAGRAEKLWPVERFRELARLLRDRALAVWGPGEEERARQIGARMAPPTNLRELTAYLRDASLVIGGDTGPLHLAAALGTPVLGLYGPTNPKRNGPYGQLDRCISTFDGSKRMSDIELRDVLERIERIGVR